MADRNLDEYQNLKFYAKNSKAKQAGFSKFEVDKEYYFCRYIDGDIAMLSQAYSSVAGRDNGIESVKKNEKIAKRFKFETRARNLHGFALKAGNGQEIAISPDYASLTQAQHVTGRLSGGTKPKKSAAKSKTPKAKTKAKKASKPKAAAAFTGADGRIENYRLLSFYKNNGGNSDGFNSFAKNGAYYFHYNADGKILLISESYTSKRGRDNGIASVKKNMKLASAYQYHQHKNGKHYFDINAANKQEIATSRWFKSKANAQKGAASLRGETPKALKANKTRKANVEQNYMPLASYKAGTKGKRKGFESFQGEDAEYYFAYFENSKIALISEGYPTAAVRDKGLASVQKNMKLKNRYVFGKGADGKEGFILRAGNNKEIARSVGYASAASAATAAAFLMGTRKRVKKKTVKPAAKLATGSVAVASIGSKGATAKAKPAKKTAKVKTVKVKAPAVKAAPIKAAPVKSVEKAKPAKKKSKSIAPLAAGTVAIAGLGASAARAKGKAVKQAAVPVKAPPMKPAAKPAQTIKAAAVAAAAVTPKPEPVVAAKPVAAAPVVQEVPVAAAPIAAATTGGGNWGWLKWLLLALLALLAMFFLFKACAGGGKTVKATKDVTTTNTSASVPMVTCWDNSKAQNNEACPSKITCWDDSFAAQQSACPVQPAAKEFECWDGSLEVDEASCPAKPVVKTAAGTTIASQPTTSVADETIKMTAPSIDGRICGPSLQPLFNVTSSSPKSISYLGSNPQFGNSLSLTPDGFYRKLSAAYQAGGSDRAFLNLLARSLGYSSFRDMDASMFSHDTLPSGTAGLLGFGSDHALQFSALNVTDPAHLEAFKVRSANGTDVHFMKRCGNFMYVCQP